MDSFDSNSCSHSFSTLSEDPTHCDACFAYAEARRHTAAARLRLADLVEKEHQALSRINTVHDELQKLPVEITSRIFQHTIIPQTAVRFKLGAVCRYWRNVAWSTPTLWNEIHFRSLPMKTIVESKDLFTLRTELMRESISRSGSLPLTINVWSPRYVLVGLEENHFQKLIDIIIQPDVVSRLSVLLLQVPSSCLWGFNNLRAPKLKKLAIRSASHDRTVPLSINLCSFTLEVVDLEIVSLNLHSSQFSCGKLSSFDVRDCSPQGIIDTMREAKNLESCNILLYGNTLMTPFIRQDAVSLPRLKSLHIGSSLPMHEINFMLESFSFPALQSLKITSRARLDLHALHSLLQRSQCPLQNLSLECRLSTWSTLDLRHLLDLLPTLTTLDIGSTIKFPNLADIFYTVFPCDSSRPSIQQFRCTWDYTPSVDHDYWGFIPKIFGPFTQMATDHHQSQPAKLIRVELRTQPNDFYSQHLLIPKDVIQAMRRPEKVGWEWGCVVLPNYDLSPRDLLKESLIHYGLESD